MNTSRGGRSLYVHRQHYCRGTRYITRDGGGGGFPERELSARGIHPSPGKTAAFPPTGHMPTPADVLLWVGVGVRIVDKAVMKGVRIPVNIDEISTESAKGIPRDRGVGNSRGSCRECQINMRPT